MPEIENFGRYSIAGDPEDATVKKPILECSVGNGPSAGCMPPE